MMKILTSKWLWLILLIFILAIFLSNPFPGIHNHPSFISELSDKSHIYLREILEYNYQLYEVMLDDVKNNLNTFYILIISGFTILIIITLQIVSVITRLPMGYLVKPNKYLVTKKSNKALPTPKKGELQ